LDHERARNDVLHDKCDCIWLIYEIQGITHLFEGTRNVFISLDDAWSDYYVFGQRQHQTLHEYFKDFQTRVQVLEHYGAVLGADGPHQDSVMDKVKADSDFVLTDEEYVALAVLATTRKKIIGIGFLKRAGRKRYDELWIELENQFTRGQEHYPNDLTGAYNLLLNYKAPSSRHQGGRREHTNTNEVSGLTFLQNSAATMLETVVLILVAKPRMPIYFYTL
jgi:hypothetical protein